MRLKIDWNTLPTLWKLNAFESYWKGSERLIDQERDRFIDDYCRKYEKHDDADIYGEALAEAQLFDEMLDQLRYASTVLLFSTIEGEIKRVLGRHRAHLSAKDSWKPGNVVDVGSNVLDALKNYLRDIGVMVREINEFTPLRDLQIVRNCIAHAGGRVDDSRHSKRLLQLSDFSVKPRRNRPQERQRGLVCLPGNVITVEPKFLEGNLRSARTFFEKLFAAFGWTPLR